MYRREFLAVAAAGAAARTLLKRLVGATTPPGAGPIDAAAFHAMRKFAQTPFGRIAYVERGTGPAALFIHGLPLNGFQWRGALERLSSTRRCIAPDSMGLGYSEIPASQDLAPGAQAEMLAALLDRLGVRSVDLVGSDSGGAVAQIFLARYPERVRSLILTNCDVHNDSPPPLLQPVIEASRAGRFADDVLVPQLEDKAKARSPQGLGSVYTDPRHLTDECIEVYLRPLTTSALRKDQFHRYCVALAVNALLPIEDLLKKSQAPVRVLWGTGDTIFSPTGPDELARIFPNFKGARKVEGANLFWPEEFPDIVAEEARKLWG
jgi:pimeloyl-ACP methyl ester carboxylesterase